MKPEQITAMRTLGAYGNNVGGLWGTYFEAAFFTHGHLCGGMPLGFRAGIVALRALGAERELNMDKLVFVETGNGHAAGCFADGVQMATGCTFGKGLIERTQYGKWALILLERATGRAVRVSVLPQVIQNSFQSPFVQQRRAGINPTDIPLEVTKPLVEKLLARTDLELFNVSTVFTYPMPKKQPPTFNLQICVLCKEVVAENKVRIKEGQHMCIPCAGYGG